MLALRLVRMIEAHSEELSKRLVQRIRESHYITAYNKLDDDELREVAAEVYTHLGAWLMERTEKDIEGFFSRRAAKRARQGIPLSDFVWALMITKETLWRYVQLNAPMEHAFEVFGELELVQAIDQFFDRAIYYATRAYQENVAAA